MWYFDKANLLNPVNPEIAPRSTKLLGVLRQFWGYSAFRPDQQQAVAAIDAGRDTLVVLPTGGGKSLCYQLPAITRGRALVVSPLISLMQDQVAALRQLGVEAEFLNSTVSQEDFKLIINRWSQNQIRLLYVAPERLLSNWFFNFIGNHPPAFFAIDEAHCISHWGHDFRPEYRKLQVLRERFPEVPICTLTATATETVRADIVQQARLRDPVIIVGDFDRPNLHYRVEQRVDRKTQVEDILRAHTGKGGIVYCISRKDTESLAEYLTGKKFTVAAYHAGLDAAIRKRVQEDFTAERLDAVIATVAFGMGIDRSNVRFVVHGAMPASIEHYQQETGRAGRDGLPAECVLLFSNGDPGKWRRIYAQDEASEAMKKTRLERLREIDQFASSNNCRHKFLVEYFGQAWQRGNCGNCDNCSDQKTMDIHPESTILAQKILSCIIRLQERFGVVYAIKVLRGETDGVQPPHCELSTYGLLKDFTAAQVRRWVDECLTQDLLFRSDDEFPVLKVSEQGWKVLRGERVAMLSALPAAGKANRPSRQERIRERGSRTALDLDDKQAELFEKLRGIRMELARERKIAAYMVLPDTSLIAIARDQPTTLVDLKKIPGIGANKLADYGAILNSAVAEWKKDND